MESLGPFHDNKNAIKDRERSMAMNLALKYGHSMPMLVFSVIGRVTSEEHRGRMLRVVGRSSVVGGNPEFLTRYLKAAPLEPVY